MDLIEITPSSHDVVLDIAYATPNNFTGKPVYSRAACFLHADAIKLFERAATLAQVLGYRFKIFDAFRPAEAQFVLWDHTPDPDFLADPNKGSPHSRGVAIDLTLIDTSGNELEMGTGFDEFDPKSHHGNLKINAEAQRNRMLLMGIMTTAGWDFYRNEWWHYQMFDAKQYPVLKDEVLPQGMM